MSRERWRTVARFIGALTVLAGLVQMLAAPFVLRLIGGGDDPAAVQFAATVGMFMILFGGMLLQATREGADAPSLLRWCAAQKLGASLAVMLGVAHGVLGGFAVLVALQDFASCFLMLGYLGSLGRGPGPEYARGG
jgi:hypothetical protein